MDRPPRDLSEDRLVDGPLIRYSYLIAGMAQAALCLLAYLSVFLWHGVPLRWLLNTGSTHWTPEAPAFEGWRCGAGGGACEALDGEETQRERERETVWVPLAAPTTLRCFPLLSTPPARELGSSPGHTRTHSTQNAPPPFFFTP